mmetsp:Transcript_5042/g.14951  ORF Transcript_5042/g.14951 Transcript_5042/m.14951 type:complete len:246 (+) Transcript_5042:1607-2344(+)
MVPASRGRTERCASAVARITHQRALRTVASLAELSLAPSTNTRLVAMVPHLGPRHGAAMAAARQTLVWVEVPSSCSESAYASRTVARAAPGSFTISARATASAQRRLAEAASTASAVLPLRRSASTPENPSVSNDIGRTACGVDDSACGVAASTHPASSLWRAANQNPASASSAVRPHRPLVPSAAASAAAGRRSERTPHKRWLPSMLPLTIPPKDAERLAQAVVKVIQAVVSGRSGIMLVAATG